MDQDTLITNIAIAILKSAELETLDWDEVSVVFDADESSNSITGNFGYTYDDAGKAKPVAFDNDALDDYVAQLREFMRVPGDTGFIRILFQLNQTNNKLNIDFEFENEDRWAVKPSSLEADIASLRPNLK